MSKSKNYVNPSVCTHLPSRLNFEVYVTVSILFYSIDVCGNRKNLKNATTLGLPIFLLLIFIHHFFLAFPSPRIKMTSLPIEIYI